MNKIREKMPVGVDAFIPLLRKTYRLIEDYQFHRTGENEMRLRLQISRVAMEMAQFKPFLHRNWQIYLEALDKQELFPISDVIFAFDSVVHQMHLRAGNKGLVREGALVEGLSPWSREMKEFLDERRKT